MPETKTPQLNNDVLPILYRQTLPLTIEVIAQEEIDPNTNVATGENFVQARITFQNKQCMTVPSQVHVADSKDDREWKLAIAYAVARAVDDLFFGVKHNLRKTYAPAKDPA